VTAALAAAKLSPDTRSALDELGYQLSLDQLAVVAAFEDDPRAVSRLTAAARGGGFDHEAQRLRQERAERAEHQQFAANWRRSVHGHRRAAVRSAAAGRSVGGSGEGTSPAAPTVRVVRDALLFYPIGGCHCGPR
jgi:hypothetical protein